MIGYLLEVFLDALTLQTFEYQINLVQGIDGLIQFHRGFALLLLILAYFPQNIDFSFQVLFDLHVEHPDFFIDFNGYSMTSLLVGRRKDDGKRSLAEILFMINLVLFQMY